MAACPSCGQEAPAGFRFCGACGALLASVVEAHRKVVTVLFCDVVGSTALGESVDPEALRALFARYFERMREIVERHGGAVEKFVGDAVMAVFGVPAVHEDDALQACRAAVEMRDALPALGIQGRVGVNTGEVVTGTEERLATGDAVNVAARLEQAAAPGEVLVGEQTLALVGGAVEVEPVEPFPLKGKAEPVAAFRLLAVHKRERRSEPRFVGRERELALVQEAWARVRAERCCELLTVVGEPGVGKSRLVAEALARLDARVVESRCPPYGEGITYWPVVGVTKQLGALPADPDAAASLRSLLGETEQTTSAEEIAWAFRKLLEQKAPLLVVFDDLQWGGELFLDLVEGAALLCQAPLLLVCLARPELLDRRPTWPVAIPLEPLADQQVDLLIGDRLTETLRKRIARTAGGNPLFVLEMLALAEQTATVEVPPTLRAVLAARLDQLDPAERRVLERAAVEGELFHRGAVQALSPDEPQLTRRLAALARKHLIRPARPLLAGEDGFRFHHLLIRDAAYETLPKATRAELHQRYVSWLEKQGADLVELDELVGYHLEQATRYTRDLGAPDSALAERAAERLHAAGLRAFFRGDMHAAVSLFERAAELIRPVRLDINIEITLSNALFYTGAHGRVAAVREAIVERAVAEGDEAAEALGRVALAVHRYYQGAASANEVETSARAVLPLVERSQDHMGIARTWGVLAMLVEPAHGQREASVRAAEQAIQHVRIAHRLAGLPQSTDLWGLDSALVHGPRPANEALQLLDDVLPEKPHAFALLCRAWLLAMLGRFDEGWPIARTASRRQSDLGCEPYEDMLAEIAALAGDHKTAVRHLRASCDWHRERGERADLAACAPRLGRMLCALGRHQEAEPFIELGRGVNNDHYSARMLWRQAQALVHASRGEHTQAETLAREAAAIADQTDALNHQGETLCDLAEVLQAAGRTEEAAEALEQALDRYERKHNWAMVAQVRPGLEALREGAPA